jgi:hypothetical protein
LLSLGVVASIYRIDHAKCANSGYGNNLPEFTLNVSNFDAAVLLGYSQKVNQSPFVKEGERTKPPCLYKVGDSYVYRVKAVKRFEVTDVQTWNFEVEDDNSYSLMGMSSHNCTLPYDVCSSCSHKSASTREYCDDKSCERGGLKNNITKVCSDGHVLCAHNPNAKFFDISHVFRPADRIAWVLGHVKTASGSVISGARLAEHWGIRPPYELVSEGLEPDIGRYVKLACMLAELEGRFTQEPILRHSSLNQSFNRFLRQPSRGLTDFAKSASQRKQLLEALHQQQALLSLPDFLVLEGSSLRQAEANSDKIAACLPDIYSRLIARPDLEEVLGKNPYLQAEKVTPSNEARFWVDKQARALSLEQRFVDERVLRATLHGNTVPTLQVLEKSAAASDDEKRAAERFALYKLALLGRWDGTTALPHLAEMVVRQNYLPGAP